MKGVGLFDLLARLLPAANSFRLIGLAAGLAITLAGFAVTGGPVLVGWWKHRHEAAAQGRQTARVATAATAIATDTATRVAAHDSEIVRIDAATQEGEHDVLSPTGASAPAPDVARGLHDALCLSASYAADPDCAAVRADRQGDGAARADPGRGAADGDKRR